MDISFLHTYRGTLYPLELPSEPQQISPLPSLVDLCCAKLVMVASSTERALFSIPRELFYNLMKAALASTKDRTIEVLVAKWPSPILKLSQFACRLFDDLGALYNNAYLSDQMRKGVKYTTCLAHTFVECLKKRAPTKLKCLDLTGYPTAEVIVNYLSSHVLLVYNEVRQKEIINMYNEVTCQLPEDQQQAYVVDSTLPDDSYVIVVDAFVPSNDTHMELCRALKTSRVHKCAFKLRLSKLVVSGFGVARITVLLEQVDPQFVTAVSLQFNSIGDEGLLILAPALRRLTHLTSLDLASNIINLSQSAAAAILAGILGSFPHLSRLDLSNNRTRGSLRLVLALVAPPGLHYLRLCGCGIAPVDLTHLRTAHSNLRHLDLSENILSGYERFQLLSEFLLSTTQLQVLELEGCRFTREELSRLFEVLAKLQTLRFLNLVRNNELFASFILDQLNNIASMSSLDVLRVSYPPECYVADSNEDVEVVKTLLPDRLAALLCSVCYQKQRAPVRLEFTQ